MATDYQQFLAGKRITAQPCGFTVDESAINPMLFGFQRKIVQWAVHRGRAAIFADCGLGKAQPIDTKVLTPSGWRRMGEIQVGDFVIGSNGKPTQVLGVYPQGERKAFRVTFTDGASVLCDGEHLWAVKDQNRRTRHQSARILTLNQIVSEGLAQGSGWRHFIPMVEPIQFPVVSLPIDPYLLGVLIGDGGLTGGLPSIASADEEILARIAAVLPGELRLRPKGGYNWGISHEGRNGHRSNPLTDSLRLLGLMEHRSEAKFIPDIYKFAHLEARIALLQGLLDTDGHVRPSDNNVEYCTVSQQLAEDVQFLVESLGGRARIREKPTSGQLAYRMSIALPDAIQPFALARKADVYHPRTKYQPARAIAAVEESSLCEMVCIAVAAEDHLYVTEHCIVTHNTAMQITWADLIVRHEDRPVLILAPLAVAQQTVQEGEKFGVTVTLCRSQADVRPGVNITNYEMLRHFDPSAFAGIVLDESSILKAYEGKTRKAITDFARTLSYRLACTATPAPNDLIEITNHAEFLDIMSGKEIIALFFAQDGNTTHEWRLKGHAREEFWRWMASWCVALRKPSDLGFSDEGFVLPPLHHHQIVVDGQASEGQLFAVEAQTLAERRKARQASTRSRVLAAANLVNNSDDTFLIWCDLNNESAALVKAIPGAVEVKGADSPEHKEQSMLDFAAGKIRVLVSKPSICGFGMNFQVCANEVFVGLSDSFEQVYQATRRCWRYGQTRDVHVYIITADTEGAVVKNIQRKEHQATEMMEEIVRHMAGLSLVRAERDEMTYEETVAQGRDWTLYLGDSVMLLDAIEDESVGLTVFSPPFPGMYAYTNSPHDIGNTKNQDEMLAQFGFLAPKLLRATMPGRMCCIHLTQSPAFKGADGYVGLKDFRGDMIKLMEASGWVYYGEVTIDKDPQVKAARTKERSLLFKTLGTDSSWMRMAMADYLIYFRKPGDNPRPIRAGVSKKYNPNGGWISEKEWIDWAHPVWTGIRETNVLNVRQARETDDERHLCPLQLDVIERAVKLWSAPGDLVLSPFAGIGSEGYVALKLGRRFVGIELKRSYWESAKVNLDRGAREKAQPTLFDEVEDAA